MPQNNSKTGEIRRNIGIIALVISLGILGSMLLQPPARYLDYEILVCESPAASRRISVNSDEAFSELINQFERDLSASSEPDYQVLNSVLSNTDRRSPSALEALSELAATNPQHKASAVYLLSACAKTVNHPACTTQMIDKAVRLDRSNAVTWSLAASLRYSQGNSYGAAVALNSAVNAPEYNDYYKDQLALIKARIPPLEDPYLAPVLNDIYNRTSALIVDDYTSINPLVMMCRTEVGSNPRLAEACISYGERMEQESDNLTGMRMGNRIRSSAYSGMDNEPEARRIQSQGRQRAREMLGNEARLASDLRDYDSSLFTAWFDNVILDGEPAAVATLISEAKRLSANEDYNPCPGTRFSNSISALLMLFNEMF